MRRPPSRLPRPGWVDILVAGFLPGALLGAQIVGLLFFLNPEVPFASDSVLRGVSLYGSAFGVLSALLHLPFLRRRPRRARRVLPWGITAALALAALLDWAHASVFAFYLPPGINIRLIRTAFLLFLAMLIAFYTALLHSLHHRRYGVRSQILLAMLVAISLYVMVERREAFHASPPPTPFPSAVEPAPRLGLLMVGLEGATLDAMLPLAEQGHLPFLSRALRQGAYGRLESLRPHRRRALWTTLATGKYPYKHHVVADQVFAADFLSPGARLKILPVGIGFRWWGLFGADPLPSPPLCEALQLWEILARVGVKAGVVGWPGGAQKPIPGEGSVFALGERFFADPDSEEAELEARPAGVTSRARLFRVPPEEIDPVVRARFGSEPPPVVLEALAEDLWRQSLTAFLLEQHREVRSVFVHLPGLGSVSRATFTGYAAVQFEGAQDREDQRAAELLSAYYAHLDDSLADLWGRLPPPAILAVVSAHGTEPAAAWRRVLTEVSGSRQLEGQVSGSPDGVLILYGTGLAGGALLTDATVSDVVPTLVYGLGLPIARDLDGEILTAAYEQSFLASHPLIFVPSYETLEASPASGASP